MMLSNSFFNDFTPRNGQHAVSTKPPKDTPLRVVSVIKREDPSTRLTCEFPKKGINKFRYISPICGRIWNLHQTWQSRIGR